MNYISIIISIAALTISGLTFWLTRLKKGVVKMTKPTIIFFGPDGGGEKHNKVFIRTLLYSTSDKGQYIQNMFIRLQRGESVQNFNVWVYDDNGLVRGSGLFVGKNGIACNHHFLLPKDGEEYSFLTGDYLLQVFIEPVNDKPKIIFEQKLQLKKEQSEEMKTRTAGTYFDWAPNTQTYFSHVDIRPKEVKEISHLNKVFTSDKKY
ncbi:hypothetical protein HME9304_01045 [Flagellimonas maritima]|uniref:Uncharacterized protein n=1 Tax=Flagellimonas maritima TaxID=1383885 RepID=A0A2Z4LQC7_9FLAO|nr:hypothetical protein [Allomuricauda aurantiaca]AWX44045.1 hypothetical protein HME9304_01045 [Allomuricauda aurantiaca]